MTPTFDVLKLEEKLALTYLIAAVLGEHNWDAVTSELSGIITSQIYELESALNIDDQDKSEDIQVANEMKKLFIKQFLRNQEYVDIHDKLSNTIHDIMALTDHSYDKNHDYNDLLSVDHNILPQNRANLMELKTLQDLNTKKTNFDTMIRWLQADPNSGPSESKKRSAISDVLRKKNPELAEKLQSLQFDENDQWSVLQSDINGKRPELKVDNERVMYMLYQDSEQEELLTKYLEHVTKQFGSISKEDLHALVNVTQEMMNEEMKVMPKQSHAAKVLNRRSDEWSRQNSRQA